MMSTYTVKKHWDTHKAQDASTINATKTLLHHMINLFNLENIFSVTKISNY
jgi:hypothetical protein